MKNIKKDIEKILSSNINSITTFLDDKGHNRFMSCVKQLSDYCEKNTTNYLKGLVIVREEKYNKK